MAIMLVMNCDFQICENENITLLSAFYYDKQSLLNAFVIHRVRSRPAGALNNIAELGTFPRNITVSKTPIICHMKIV